MAKIVSTILGAAFILIGVLGFLLPNLLGTHLSLAHNVVHLVSGGAALYFGLAGTLAGARLFAFVFGATYFLLGVVGFLFGGTTIGLPPHLMAGGVNEHMLRLIPGVLEFGTMDHIVHLLIGAAFLAGALLSKVSVKPLLDGPQ